MESRDSRGLFGTDLTKALAKQHVNLTHVVFRGSDQVKAIYFIFFTVEALHPPLAGS
jgi:hypothetical protein